jgi:hypothetical protein
MNRILRLKDGSSIDLVGAGVIGFVALIVAFLVWQIAPIVSLYRHPPTEVATTRSESGAARKYEQALAWDRDQVNGRSLFYTPLKPDEKPPEQIATYYDGPSLSMFVNGTAYFSDGQKVSAAEPDAQSLHFIRADPPWSVRVRWKGTEFDVPIFERTRLSSLTSTLSGAFSSFIPPAKPQTPAAAQQTPPRGSLSPEGQLGPGADMPPPPPPVVAGGGPPPGGEPPSGSPPAPPSNEPSPTPAPPGTAPGSPSTPPAPGSPSGEPAPAHPSNEPSPSPSDPPKEPGHAPDHRISP